MKEKFQLAGLSMVEYKPSRDACIERPREIIEYGYDLKNLANHFSIYH